MVEIRSHWVVLTRPETAFVNPCVNVVALSFQLVDVRSQIRNFAFEVVDLFIVRSERRVEGLGQKIGQRLGLC